MEKISGNNYYYLSFGILAITIIVLFLSLFVIAIKTKGDRKLIVFTKYFLAASLVINLIIYLKIDLTILLPLRMVFTFSEVNFYIVLRFIFLLIFLLFFLLMLIKPTEKITKAIWLFFLMFNSFDILLKTYYFITWSKPAQAKNSILADAIFSHQYEYTFARYLLNICIPIFWVTLSIIAANKIYRQKKDASLQSAF
jgi:hypothetical protein